MNCSKFNGQLNDYIDGDLGAAETAALVAHLEQCGTCNRAAVNLRQLVSAARALPGEIQPSRNLWSEIRQELEPRSAQSISPMTVTVEPDVPIGLVQERADDSPMGTSGSTVRSFRTINENALRTHGCGFARHAGEFSFARWFAPVALAASVAFLATFNERRTIVPAALPGWTVASLAGAPQMGTRLVGGEGQFRIGQWLETDATSRAKVAAAGVGEVTVDPNSRLRLTGTKATEHRLELARGKLSALIWAPPRLFFVDTPSATAIDLGCAYTIAVDDEGDGELHVTTGYVALEHGNRESIIPSGAMCLTRRGAGPGTPFVENAPPALREALKRFDFQTGAARPAVADIVHLTRPEDTITLWHLLARTNATERGVLFDALARYSTPPAGVTRGGIVAGDIAMRRMWGDALGFSFR